MEKDRNVLTDEEKAALLDEDDAELEREIAEAERTNKKEYPLKKYMPFVKGALLGCGLSGLLIGAYIIGYNKKTREIENHVQEIYAEANQDAQKIYEDAIRRAELATRVITNPREGGSELLEELIRDGLISNLSLMQKDEDGLVYAAFGKTWDINKLKEVVINPEKFNFTRGIEKPGLYSTLEEAQKVRNTKYIFEFNSKGEITNIHDTNTSLPVDY